VPLRQRAGGGTDALDDLDERADEAEAAQLAVADDVDARLLLDGDGLVDRPILDALELARAQLPERCSSLAALRYPGRSIDPTTSARYVTVSTGIASPHSRRPSDPRGAAGRRLARACRAA
jgi:hypothetical protein